MKTIGKIAATLSLLLAVSSGTAEAQQQWRLASKLPAGSAEGRVYQKFADLVKDYSGGKLAVQVYPSEQLGKEAAVLEQLQGGTIHLFVDAAFMMQRWDPDLKWMGASFVFSDRDHWVRFMETPLAKSWFDNVERKSGIVTLGRLTDVVRGPYRTLVSKRPVKSVADLRGLKLRMYPDQLATSVWTHLGASPQQLSITETYQALKTGVVEAVTIPIALVEDLKFSEVAPHVLRTDEFFQEIAFMMNAKAFRSLSPDLQQAMLRAHKDVGTFSVQVMNESAASTLKSMSAKGVQYTEIDTKGMVARAREFYQAEEKAGRVPAGYFEAVEKTRSR